jgi:DNA replication protein DnaC
MLLGFYRARVEQRQMCFTCDYYVESNLHAMADILTRESHQRFGIMLSGLFGNGKTTMLQTLADIIAYLDNAGLIDRSGWDGKVELTILSARHIASTARADTPGAFDAICRLGLLAIDDLGTEPADVMAYGNICSPITELLEYRYDKRLPTLISTNLTPPMITQRYSERVGDRLKEMMDVVVFEADSYRR